VCMYVYVCVCVCMYVCMCMYEVIITPVNYAQFVQ